MVDVLRFHEISEKSHWVMNPVSVEKFDLVGQICGVGPDSDVLDLACGKGALLARFAGQCGARGVGVDIHAPFLAEAQRVAEDLDLVDKLTFRHADAGDPTCVDGEFDVVSCIGATWIGGGLTGSLQLMRHWLAPGGWLLVGECYWKEVPSDACRTRHSSGEEGFTDLPGTLERFQALDLDLVEMTIASTEEWDRYAASQWLNVSDWLATHSSDPEAGEVRRTRDESRRAYLEEDRRVLGWGIFVLREENP